MKRPEYIPSFSKALLAGALTGLIATVVNLVYNVIFRSITQYIPDEEFNFLSITLLSFIVLILIGMLYFLFAKYSNAKIFDIILIVLMLGCVAVTIFFHTANEPMLYGNHGLIAGFIIISGLLAVTLLPYLYNHPRLFL